MVDDTKLTGYTLVRQTFTSLSVTGSFEYLIITLVLQTCFETR
jgi:hypothetical protein